MLGQGIYFQQKMTTLSFEWRQDEFHEFQSLAHHGDQRRGSSPGGGTPCKRQRGRPWCVTFRRQNRQDHRAEPGWRHLRHPGADSCAQDGRSPGCHGARGKQGRRHGQSGVGLRGQIGPGRFDGPAQRHRLARHRPQRVPVTAVRPRQGLRPSGPGGLLAAHPGRPAVPAGQGCEGADRPRQVQAQLGQFRHLGHWRGQPPGWHRLRHAHGH